MARNHRRRSPSRRSSAIRKDAYGYAIISAVLLLGSVFGLGAWWFWPASVDKQTNCPTTGPIAYVTFLLDLTDPLTDNQVKALHNHFARVRDQVVPTRGALELYAVEGDGERSLLAKVLKCKPENPNDEEDTAGVGLIKSAKRMQQRWNNDYQIVFDRALQDATSKDKAAVSPLLEAVQSVTVQSFNVPGREQKQKVLVLISDLMQNSSNITFYKGIPSLQSLVQSDAYKRLGADLTGVAVLIYQIARPEHEATEGVLKLWVELLQLQGASVLICDDLMKFRDIDDQQGCALSGGAVHE